MLESSEGNRDNPYNFDDYLLVRENYNFYRDDDFFQALVKVFVPENEFENIHRDLSALSDIVSFFLFS